MGTRTLESKGNSGVLKDYQIKLIDAILQNSALEFSEFVLSSGRASPYFLNLGELNTGASTEVLAEAYAEVISKAVAQEGIEGPTVYLYGIPEKCVAFASPITVALHHRKIEARWFFTRKYPKDNGEATGSAETDAKSNFVGGIPPEGSFVVVVDDVFTLGITKLKELEKLKKFGITPNIIVIAVNRQQVGPNGNDALKEFIEATKTEADPDGISVLSILKVTDILQYLRMQAEYVSSRAEYLREPAEYLRQQAEYFLRDRAESPGNANVPIPSWLAEPETRHVQEGIDYDESVERMSSYLQKQGTEEAILEIQRQTGQ